MKFHTTTSILLVLLLSGIAPAETVYLNGGGTLEGEVLDLGDEALVMTLKGLEGSRVEVPLARVSEYSLFELRRARIDGDSAEDHEGLGDWARGRGLLALAMEEYKAAITLLGKDAPDALKAKHDDVSVRCGADKLARGQQLLTEGDLEGARAFFRDIIENHPTCPAAEKAKAQVQILSEKIRKQRLEARAETDRARLEQNVKDRIETAKHLRDLGDGRRRLGLRESGSLGRAEDAFLAAIEAFRRAQAVLVEVAKLPGARDHKAEIGNLRTELDRRLADVYVDVGHNYVVKGNLIRANHYMGLALAIDPNDPKALALRRTIGRATADDSWGRPRR